MHVANCYDRDKRVVRGRINKQRTDKEIHGSFIPMEDERISSISLELFD